MTLIRQLKCLAVKLLLLVIMTTTILLLLLSIIFFCFCTNWGTHSLACNGYIIPESILYFSVKWIFYVNHWHPLCIPAHVTATISSSATSPYFSTSSAISNCRLNTHTATQLTPERPTRVCACVCNVVSCFMRISSIATVNALKRRGTAGRDHCLCSLRMRGEIKERGREREWGIGAREGGRENKSERAWARSLWSSKIVTFAWTNSFLPWRPCQYGIVLIKTQLHLKLDELLIGPHEENKPWKKQLL